MALTVATVRDGHVTVHILNVQGGKVKLPPRRLLGKREPVGATVTMIEVAGGLQRDAVEKWVDVMGGHATQPLPGEGDIDTAQLRGKGKELKLRLLRCCPRLLKRHEGCPPPVTMGVVQRHRYTCDATVTRSRRTARSTSRSKRC